MQTNMKKLGIYLRVSTEVQADDDRYSIPLQREAGKKFAEDKGVDYEVFEDHKSGGNIERAGWQALFEKVESGEIDGIWIAKFDRFSRDTADGMTAIKLMRKANCQLWVNSLEYDINDYNTEFQITMHFAFAAYEKAQIKARTTAGKKKARDEGNRVVIDMLGWDRYLDENGKRAVRLNEDEAKIVRLIFAEFLAGTNIPDIGRKLVDAGYKGKYSGKTYRYKSGDEKVCEDRWTYSTIKQVLQHPEYCGLTYDAARTKLIKSKKYVTPIVSKEHWDEAQAILRAKRATFDPKSGYRIVEHFASGFLTCEKCGARYYHVNFRGGKRSGHTNDHFYYVHKKLTPAQRACETKATLLPVDEVEDFLNVIYVDVFRSSKAMAEIFEKEKKAIARDEADLQKEETRIGRLLAENSKKATYYLQAIAKGIDLDGIKEETDTLKSEKAKLTTELEKRRREFEMKTSDRKAIIDQFSRDTLKKFLTETGSVKRAMLKKLTKSATVSDGNGTRKIMNVETVAKKWSIDLMKPTRQQAYLRNEYKSEGWYFKMKTILELRNGVDDLGDVMAGEDTSKLLEDIDDLWDDRA